MASASDNNTKYFHQFANLRKNINTIWEIINEDGSMVNSFKEKAEAGASYFQSIFKAPDGCPIQEILHVVSKFLMMIGEEMNKSLEEEVSES
jgi:hypothetical protein